MGVAFASVTGGLFCTIAPTMTAPVTIIELGSPLLALANCASPMVPPAPPLFSNCAFFATPASTIALPSPRPV